jgi:multiple sugar transport system substrate-binding protein
MKKVKFLTSILALSMITSVLAGCGSKSTTPTTPNADNNKPVEITWWDYPNFQTGTGGDYEKKIIAKFNEKYPNIKVNIEMIDFASGPQKLNTAIASNSAPDMVYDYPGRIIDYARNGVMAPLDDLLTDSVKKDIAKEILNPCSLNGKVYMYPINISPNMMVFNKTMLDKAGLTSMLPLNKKDRLWTNDEYYALLKAIKEKVPGIVAPTAVFAKSSGGDQGTRAYISNMGGVQTMASDLSKYTLNDPSDAKALQWIADSVKSGLTLKGGEALASNDVIDMYLGEKIAVAPLYNKVLMGTSAAKKKTAFEEVFVPYPTPSASVKPALEAFIGGIGVFDNKNPDKIAAAKKLVNFIANDSATFKDTLLQTGGFSVKTSVTGLYTDAESKYCESMIKYLGTYYNQVPGFAEMRTYYFPMLQNVLLGKQTAQVGLDEFVTKANETLKKK